MFSWLFTFPFLFLTSTTAFLYPKRMYITSLKRKNTPKREREKIFISYMSGQLACIKPAVYAQEDGWVVCRVFKKKNLFKMGNEGGGSSINSDYQQQHQHHQQQLGNINSTSIHNQQVRTNFMHRDNHHYGLRQQHQPFELNKPADLALHYSGHLQPSQYSLFPSAEVLISTQQKPQGGYNFGSTRDGESGGDSFRYGGSHHHQQTCEPGLDVGTCEQAQAQAQSVIGGANCREDPGISSEWAMLVGPHHMGNDPHTHQHQQDSSKAKGFEIEDSDPSPVHHHMNQLSLRGEMDFWGYNAK